MVNEARAVKWFAKLKRVVKEMPPDVEILVSGLNVVSMLERGTIASHSSSQYGMDRITEEEMASFINRNVTGENSSI